MKIGIDASRYGAKNSTGVEWYCRHLIDNLLPLLGRYHEHEFVLYLRDEVEFEEELPFNVKTKLIKPRKGWTKIGLSLEMLFKKIDRLFVPSHVFPFFTPKNSVITIHDLAFMHKELKECYNWSERIKQKKETRRAIKKAGKIIVPSISTNNDLINFFKCSAEKIKVVYHGGPQWQPGENPALKKWGEKEKKDFLGKYKLGIKDTMILFVGRVELKKNLLNLLDGFARFLKEYPDWKLVLAGKPGFGYEKIVAKISSLNIAKNVILTGYIEEKDKFFLLEKCKIFAFVSKFEGFGLPILEAWAVRRPVITSSSSACGEIAGDAALKVNPDNIAEISVGLKRLAFDGMLVNKLIEKGEARLIEFNWEKAAKETLEILMG